MEETKNDKTSSFGDLHDQWILFPFLYWFFVIAPKKIVEIWFTYMAAGLHYFSIPLLLRTLFAHWHRDIEGYGRGFDFSRWSRVFIMNMISRGIGFIIRSVTICIGLVAEVMIFMAGLVFLMFWLVAPLIIIWSLFYGFQIFFSN